MKIEEVLNSLASTVLPQHSSHGRLRMEEEEGGGGISGRGGGQGEEQCVANLDGPLAVHGRRIEAGVQRGGEDSLFTREDSTTGFDWERTHQIFTFVLNTL